jgi:hypothetical protein
LAASRTDRPGPRRPGSPRRRRIRNRPRMRIRRRSGRTAGHRVGATNRAGSRQPGGFRRVRFGGLEQQPGFRLGVSDRRFLGGLSWAIRRLQRHGPERHRCGRRWNARCGWTVELAQCVEHLAAGGAEHPGQRMHAGVRAGPHPRRRVSFPDSARSSV